MDSIACVIGVATVWITVIVIAIVIAGVVGWGDRVRIGVGGINRVGPGAGTVIGNRACFVAGR